MKKSKLTSEQKYFKAKSDYEKGLFDTKDEAAVANGMSPANFYIYAKRDRLAPASNSIQTQILTSNSTADIQTLMQENRTLKSKIEEEEGIIQSLKMKVEKMKAKIADLVTADL